MTKYDILFGWYFFSQATWWNKKRVFHELDDRMAYSDTDDDELHKHHHKVLLNSND